MGSLSVMPHYCTSKVRIFFRIQVRAFLLTALKLVHSFQYLAYRQKSVVCCIKNFIFLFIIFFIALLTIINDHVINEISDDMSYMNTTLYSLL